MRNLEHSSGTLCRSFHGTQCGTGTLESKHWRGLHPERWVERHPYSHPERSIHPLGMERWNGAIQTDHTSAIGIDCDRYFVTGSYEVSLQLNTRPQRPGATHGMEQ